MFGSLPVLPRGSDRLASALGWSLGTWFTPRSLRPLRSRDALAILLVWLASLCLSLLVEPHHYEVSTQELLYFTFYNVAVGSLVGFYFFDRLAKHGLALFIVRAAIAILAGTLVNEAVVEPIVFGAGPINGESVYYGLTDAVSTSGFFLLLRLAERLQVLQQGVRSAPETRNGQRVSPASSKTVDAHAGCFFVRVAGETRRIYAADVVYMEAQRDFTRILCTTGEHFVSESLKSVMAKSAEQGLIRVHKSFAVNLRRVERLTGTEVWLGERRVPVGRRYRPTFVEIWRDRFPQ